MKYDYNKMRVKTKNVEHTKDNKQDKVVKSTLLNDIHHKELGFRWFERTFL